MADLLQSTQHHSIIPRTRRRYQQVHSQTFRTGFSSPPGSTGLQTPALVVSCLAACSPAQDIIRAQTSTVSLLEPLPSNAAHQQGFLSGPDSITKPRSSDDAFVTQPLQQPATKTKRMTAARLTNKIKSCTSWQELQELYYRHHTNYDFMHLSACITHLAQLSRSIQDEQPQQPDSHSNTQVHQQNTSEDPQGPQLDTTSQSASHPGGTICKAPYNDLLACLLSDLMPKLQQLRAREAANITWAVAKLGCSPQHPVVQSVVDTTWTHIRSMNSQELSNTLYAAGLLGFRPPKTAFTDIETAVLQLFPTCEAYAQSNIVWGLGRLEFRSSQSMQRVLFQATYSNLYQMPPQGLCMCAYGIACLGKGMPRLWRDRLLDAAWRHLQQPPSPQQLLHTAAEPLLKTYQPLNLQSSNTVTQTNSTSQPYHSSSMTSQSQTSYPSVMSHLSHTDHTSHTGFGYTSWTTSGLVQLMYAVVRSGKRIPKPFMSAALQQIVIGIDSLAAVELVSLLWTLAACQIRPPVETLVQLLSQISRQLDDCSPEGLAAVVWSLAGLGVKPSRQLADQLLRVVYRRRSQLPARSAITVLSSLLRMQLKTNMKFTHGLLQACLPDLETRGTARDLVHLTAALVELPHPLPDGYSVVLDKLFSLYGDTLHDKRQQVLERLAQVGVVPTS